ncbi:MAG TPA: serine/threonine-protein kinase, partial [Longimicrobium sp.]|nr:serine/threonine-protein kinase [Longimicrobium sp.]
MTIPRTLGRYQIEEEIGAGGMGVVHRAVDTQLKRTVALKTISDPPEDDGAREAVMREARAASALSHPHICTVYEVDEADGCSYVVMEHVEGRTLNRLIPPDGLPPETTLRYGVQVADALAHAHDRGVVHRDLKGANVMVTPEGRVKVLDFGLARRVREGHRAAATESEASAEDERRTAGTVAFMAPEALQGKPPDPRDDIWALGVLLYEMATGERPFRGDTGYELASAIQRDAPAPLPPRVPPALRSIILRCL